MILVFEHQGQRVGILAEEVVAVRPRYLTSLADETEVDGCVVSLRCGDEFSVGADASDVIDAWTRAVET